MADDPDEEGTLPTVIIYSSGEVNHLVETSAGVTDAVLSKLDYATVFRIAEGDARGIPERLSAEPVKLVTIQAKLERAIRDRRRATRHAYALAISIVILATALGLAVLALGWGSMP